MACWMKKAAEDKSTTVKETQTDEVHSLGVFGSALFDLGWRLAITVVLFLWFGNWLDNRLSTKPFFSLLGFFLVVVAFVLLLKQILKKVPRSQGGLKDD
jgi:uncharacterized membrane protein YfcA